ncbi:hypothetical protein AVEN_251447-1 [Araneus ventricosus]|uniref:Uncharacterized protein n=1 Tax=Araneus ventricosus TaxID=182803 RepID=A0A4Y2W185_ARAVE|nr:hypothetical protein AVEN_251447-1 [Araneus ventricosus]
MHSNDQNFDERNLGCAAKDKDTGLERGGFAIEGAEPSTRRSMGNPASMRYQSTFTFLIELIQTRPPTHAILQIGQLPNSFRKSLHGNVLERMPFVQRAGNQFPADYTSVTNRRVTFISPVGPSTTTVQGRVPEGSWISFRSLNSTTCLSRKHNTASPSL